MLTITSLEAKINGSFAGITVKNCDLSYCLKPTRQSWDFNEAGSAQFYVNLGIDTVKFSVEQATSGFLPQVGEEVELRLNNAVEKISGKFIVIDAAIKNGFYVVTAMPKLGEALVEEAA